MVRWYWVCFDTIRCNDSGGCGDGYVIVVIYCTECLGPEVLGMSMVRNGVKV